MSHADAAHPIADDPLHVEGREGGPVATVCYLLTDRLADDAPWALVDPVDDVLRIWSDRLRDRPPPAAVFVTHGHFDHIGGLAEIAERYPQAPIWVHPDSAAMLTDGTLNGAALFMLPYRPARASHFYREGETVAVGACRFRVLDTPGHCPGSVSLLCGRHLIAGDVLFAGGVGRWDLPGADYETLAAAIRDKLMPLPDDTIVYPGHGPATTIGDERTGNPYVAQMLAEAPPPGVAD
jgi:glyoxylase-like metal-dependent hydrolase (beta-lactamase superfamily II)